MGSEKKRIVIVGTGFAGLYTYKSIRNKTQSSNIEIALINDTNYFLFTPMLHEVATGGLGQHNIIFPIRDVLHKDLDMFFQTKVNSIDLDNAVLATSNGDINYDYLVISTGAKTNYCNVFGAEKHSFALKTLEDAVELRSHFIDTFERAAHESDENKRKQLLTFTVVGAGPTGVELIAEMAEYFYGTFYKTYGKSEFLNCLNEVSLNLVSSSNTVLPRFSKNTQEVAMRTLTRKGINLYLNKAVTSVSPTELAFESGDTLRTNTTVWTAGVIPQLPDLKGSVSYNRGRLVVTEMLQLPFYSNVFSLGDAANLSEETNVSIPMLAQAASKESQIASRNLLALLEGIPLKKFSFKNDGLLVSLGQWMAAGTVKGINIRGRVAWWIWRTIYLAKFISWKKRFGIAVDWTVNLFTNRDISKLN